MRIIRATGEENHRLLEYLRKEPFNVSDLWRELADTWDGWNDALEAIGSSSEEVEDLANADNMEAVWDICRKLEKWFSSHGDEKQEAAVDMCAQYPELAPTWAHLTLSRNTLLPSGTWLVHFTDFAEEIVENGFRVGIDDVSRLGLTTFLRKSGPGYDFAFLADDRAALSGTRYGKDCVLFQSSGVYVHHTADEEHQVIFWGPSITTEPVMIAHTDDGWEVHDRDGRRVEAASNLTKLSACITWVKQNRRRLG